MIAVRVGTWNVQYARGAAKNRARRDLLEGQNAHIWVLTETHDDLDLSDSHTAIHSEQRYATPGGRWTTIWSALPIIEAIAATDPQRCVAARLDAGEAGEIVVYGTVLPWNGDVGPDVAHPATGWEEFRRVVPAQGREWSALRDRYPSATLIVAGDLNQDMGGKHYYGTKAGRALLADQLSNAGLRCLTSTDRFEVGVLEHPPIDHVCGSPGQGSSFTSSAHGWNNVVDGIKLSDHGGTIVTLGFNADVRSAGHRSD